jgi:hypothetical protein
MSNLKKWLEIKKQSRFFLIEMQKQLDTVDFGIEKSIRQTLNSLNITDPDIILSHFPEQLLFSKSGIALQRSLERSTAGT